MVVWSSEWKEGLTAKRYMKRNFLVMKMCSLDCGDGGM